MRVPPGLDAVLRLVEERSRLLPLERIGDQPHFALEELHRTGRRAAQHPLPQRQALMRAHLGVVALDDGPGRPLRLEQRGEHLPPRLRRLDERLHAEHVGVPIDDEPRQQIRFAVHDAPGPPPLGIRPGRIAQRLRRHEAAREEILVHRFVLAGEEPHRDLARAPVEGPAEEVAALILEADHLAPAKLGRRANVAAVHPDVTLAQPVHAMARNDHGDLAAHLCDSTRREATVDL